MGKWLVWDQSRWAVDNTREVERRAKETVLAIYQGLPHIRDDDKRHKAAQHALRSQAEARLR